MSTNITMSVPAEIRLQVKRVPMPEGVKWSHVMAVMMMAAVANKRKKSQEDFRKQIDNNPNYVKVRDWLKDIYEGYLD